MATKKKSLVDRLPTHRDGELAFIQLNREQWWGLVLARISYGGPGEGMMSLKNAMRRAVEELMELEEKPLELPLKRVKDEWGDPRSLVLVIENPLEEDEPVNIRIERRKREGG